MRGLNQLGMFVEVVRAAVLPCFLVFPRAHCRNAALRDLPAAVPSTSPSGSSGSSSRLPLNLPVRLHVQRTRRRECFAFSRLVTFGGVVLRLTRAKTRSGSTVARYSPPPARPHRFEINDLHSCLLGYHPHPYPPRPAPCMHPLVFQGCLGRHCHRSVPFFFVSFLPDRCRRQRPRIHTRIHTPTTSTSTLHRGGGAPPLHALGGRRTAHPPHLQGGTPTPRGGKGARRSSLGGEGWTSGGGDGGSRGGVVGAAGDLLVPRHPASAAAVACGEGGEANGTGDLQQGRWASTHTLDGMGGPTRLAILVEIKNNLGHRCEVNE